MPPDITLTTEARVRAAALEVFLRDGFDGARTDDIAALAGVGKGTLYRYFASKEAMLQAIVQAAIPPVVMGLQAMAAAHRGPVEPLIRSLVAALRREVLDTEKQHILRLVICEGRRHPAIATHYYDNVVQPGMALVAGLARRACDSGEWTDTALARHPQLLVAPVITSVVWQMLFGPIAPLDAGALIEAQLDLMFVALRGTAGAPPVRFATPTRKKSAKGP
ncbi:TetR/AcrR family transcriptional regulator [Ideonella sp. BN130291]|uniref:TetR/AcrR family transcriptional regulator n=1 Tax=Ideonella sp. BN130291 TaxID=3112940 RepID=UPI002E253F9F|nr:TetR/AcrR family transcriptional regulator [Ideonella sp. BN130291]